MGQKVNPIIFRLGNSDPNYFSWSTNLNSYSHLLYQDIEIRKFLLNLLRSKGILMRGCKIKRSDNKLVVSLDLYFSYIMSKQAKFVWARSLFKTIKKSTQKSIELRTLKI